MKFVPEAVQRTVARQALLARKNSPTILFGAGIVGMVGSTVLACHATLKVEGVLHEIQAEKHQAREVKAAVDANRVPTDVTYTDDEVAQDLRVITMRGAGRVARLYLPAVVLGGASVFMLTKSHNLLQERNAALVAAYVAVDEAFKRYRAKVVEKYGEEEDRALRYDAEYVDIIDDETGKVISQLQVSDDQEASQYARWFDEESPNWNRNSGYNLLFLRSQQNYWNDVLRARGHVFLNEVYRELGLSHTEAGSVVGWIRFDNGDGFIDFGCWDGQEGLDFFNGRDGAILLDFNVDGIIFDKINESQAAQQWGAEGRA